MDFIVTVHALERMLERFPKDTHGLDDSEIGALIHREVLDAVASGRQASILPVEFAPYLHSSWKPAKPGGSFVWTEDKRRCYVLQEGSDGQSVLTVCGRNDPPE